MFYSSLLQLQRYSFQSDIGSAALGTWPAAIFVMEAQNFIFKQRCENINFETNIWVYETI